MIDETGVRVGTFAYDSQGRVLSSEKANGAERLTFLYNADKSTSITDYTPPPTGVGAPTATTRTHRFGTAQGVVRPTSVTAPCPVCGNTAASTAYDVSNAHQLAMKNPPAKDKCTGCVKVRAIDNYHAACFAACNVPRLCYGNATGLGSPWMMGK